MPRLSAEELADRRSFLGASEIGAIMGLNPHRDAFAVLNAKYGFVEEEPPALTDAREIGHRLEPVIRQLYLDDQQVTLIPCGTVRHPSQSWAGATLDATVVGTKRGLEVKAVGLRTMSEWSESDDDGVPHYVRLQAVWQMWVVGLEEIDVAALIGGTRFRFWRIKRDSELERRAVVFAEEWWRRHVIERLAPALTDSNACREYLDGKYPPQPAPVLVDADTEADELARTRRAADGQIKGGEKSKDECTAGLIAWLGARNADTIVGRGWRFTYRANKNGERRPSLRWKDEG